MGAAREQKAEIVARKSKSSDNKDKTEDSEKVEATETGDVLDPGPADSTDENPVIFEAEAVGVEEMTSEVGTDASEPEFSQAGAQVDEQEAEPVDVQEGVIHATESLPHSGSENSPKGGVSFILLALGGAVAGAIGYFAATLAPPPPQPELDTSELTTGIAANASSLEAVSAELSELRDAPEPVVDTSALEGQLTEAIRGIEGLTSDLAAVQTRLEDVASSFEKQALELDGRILALETALPAVTGLAADDELAALRARIEEMTANAQLQLTQTQSEAADIARAAEEARLAAEAEVAEALAVAEARQAELEAMAQRQEKLIDLKISVESGAAFADILEGLDDAPEVLVANAETGVPTIQALQQSFPAAARSALTQTETVPEDASTGERLTAFLKRRTNARSLTPKDGDGPDAVLSRAEAHLGEGDLISTLSELDALSEASKAALSDWLTAAGTRLSAIEAVDELSATN